MHGRGAERAKAIAPEPAIRQVDATHLSCEHASLGKFTFEALTDRRAVSLHRERDEFRDGCTRSPNRTPYVKDAFDRYVVHGERDAVNPQQWAPKPRRIIAERIEAGKGIELRFRLQRGKRSRSNRFRRTFSRSASAKRTSSTGSNADSPAALADRAAGGGRAVVVEAVLSLCGAAVAGRRSGPSPASGRSAGTAATTSGSTSTTAT